MEYRYGQRQDAETRLKRLEMHKIALAKLFGLGKSSKAKPGSILEHARTLYDALKLELKETDDDD